MRKSYVYFLQNPDTKRIKIGSSVNLSMRFHRHRVMYGRDLVFLGVIEGTLYEEILLHKVFAADRVGGYEWFEPNPILLEYIQENAFIVDVPPYRTYKRKL